MKDFEYVAKKLEISSDELQKYHTMPKKYYWDYKNSKKIFDIGEWVLNRIVGARRGGAY